MLRLLFLLALLNSAVAANVNPQSTATAVANVLDSGLVNNHYTVSANHSAFIFNDSGVAATFVYAYKLCADNNGCHNYPFAQTLKPHVGINVTFISKLDVIFTLPGVYTITATTSIIGPNVSVLSTGTAPANIILPNPQ